jgi:hypothetical protein
MSVVVRTVTYASAIRANSATRACFRKTRKKPRPHAFASSLSSDDDDALWSDCDSDEPNELEPNELVPNKPIPQDAGNELLIEEQVVAAGGDVPPKNAPAPLASRLAHVSTPPVLGFRNGEEEHPSSMGY